MRKGDLFMCLVDIKGDLSEILFKKDCVYQVLYVNNETFETKVCLSNMKKTELKCELVLKNFKKYKKI
jgi:hypothetical protein